MNDKSSYAIPIVDMTLFFFLQVRIAKDETGASRIPSSADAKATKFDTVSAQGPDVPSIAKHQVQMGADGIIMLEVNHDYNDARAWDADGSFSPSFIQQHRAHTHGKLQVTRGKQLSARVHPVGCPVGMACHDGNRWMP